MEKQYGSYRAVHPGETLNDILVSIGMEQNELAQRAGLTPKTINEIVQEKSPVTPNTAILLSAVFGMSAAFWNNMQINYDENMAAIKAEKKYEEELPLLDKYSCYNELIKLGYVKKTRDVKGKVLNLCNFFGVSSLSLVPKMQVIAYRKSKIRNLSREALAAWLRCGEIEANKMETAIFDRNKLLDSVESLRKLTNEDPKVFHKQMIEICSSFGVALIWIPYFKSTFVCGATRWINPEKAMIQLNIRGKYSDILWFTFFHELAHLLKHGKKEQFVDLEGDDEKEDKENEADEYALNTLIPKSEYKMFFNSREYSDVSIKRFAKNMKISTDIVAGRLSHDLNNWRKYNHLRKRLRFV